MDADDKERSRRWLEAVCVALRAGNELPAYPFPGSVEDQIGVMQRLARILPTSESEAEFVALMYGIVHQCMGFGARDLKRLCDVLGALLDAVNVERGHRLIRRRKRA
jgi:hypothetical protein